MGLVKPFFLCYTSKNNNWREVQMSYKGRRNASCQQPYYKRKGPYNGNGKDNGKNKQISRSSNSREYLPSVAGNNSRRSLLIPDRDIPDGPYISRFNKEELRNIDLALSEIRLPIDTYLDEFVEKTNSGRFLLSNVPTLVEYANLQRYHVNFSKDELLKMLRSPKVVIDRQHSSFEFQKSIMNRTSFVAVAPHLFNENLPCLYRLSIARELRHPEHYSVSMHAIISGLADGYLFLGRIDNNTARFHLGAATVGRKFTIKHANGETSVVSGTSSEEAIPFPHIHLANPKYVPGDIPEQCEPMIFSDKKPENISESLEHMMGLTSIQSKPKFYNQNVSLKKILYDFYDLPRVESTNSGELMRETKMLERMFVESHSQIYHKKGLLASEPSKANSVYKPI